MVFVTKNRELFIDDRKMDIIRQVMTEKANQLNAKIFIINGYLDHIHILLSSPPKLSLSEIAKNLKGLSSFKIDDLVWQSGYGVFTVDASSFDRVFQYIENQRIHHEL